MRAGQVCGMLRYAAPQMCSMRSPSTSTLSLYPTQHNNNNNNNNKKRKKGNVEKNSFAIWIWIVYFKTCDIMNSGEEAATCHQMWAQIIQTDHHVPPLFISVEFLNCFCLFPYISNTGRSNPWPLTWPRIWPASIISNTVFYHKGRRGPLQYLRFPFVHLSDH